MSKTTRLKINKPNDYDDVVQLLLAKSINTPMFRQRSKVWYLDRTDAKQNLTDRELLILYMRVVGGETFSHIGSTINVSISAVQQLFNRVMRIIRRKYNDTCNLNNMDREEYYHQIAVNYVMLILSHNLWTFSPTGQIMSLYPKGRTYDVAGGSGYNTGLPKHITQHLASITLRELSK